ncbi:MAG: UDP-N-acetylmuramoyl-L-alanyl-D-glutamate--2,6-diaminopimelate ligase [Candidatus Saccharimonadales bacterium]
MKKLIKSLLPSSLVKPILRPYHFSRALLANLIYGFPARGLKVIGITGTNGKTTSANYLASILGAAGYKVGVSTTANFRIGEEAWDNELNMTTTNPFALQKLLRRMREAQVDWVVLEVTSHALSQYRTWGVPIHTAVLTNLSPDHLDYHGTVEEYAATKAKLLCQARVATVLNRDDEWYDYFRKSAFHAAYTYGTAKEADVRLEKAKLHSDTSHIKIRYGERMMELDLQLPGKFNVYNALAAATVAFGLEIDWEDVQAGLKLLSGVPGRMEAIHTGQDFTVIVDYAHTPDAFENVLGNLRPVTKGRIITVFGGAPTHDYRGLGEAAGRLSDVVIVTDDEPMDSDPRVIREEIVEAARTAATAQVEEIADRRDGIARAFALAGADDTVALLCLGHQKYRRIGNAQRIEWDDRAVARELLETMA